MTLGVWYDVIIPSSWVLLVVVCFADCEKIECVTVHITYKHANAGCKMLAEGFALLLSCAIHIMRDHSAIVNRSLTNYAYNYNYGVQESG